MLRYQNENNEFRSFIVKYYFDYFLSFDYVHRQTVTSPDLKECGSVSLFVFVQATILFLFCSKKVPMKIVYIQDGSFQVGTYSKMKLCVCVCRYVQ